MGLVFYTEHVVKAGQQVRWDDDWNMYNALVRCWVVNQGADVVIIRHLKCSWEESYSTINPNVIFCRRDCFSNRFVQVTLNPGEVYEREVPLRLTSPSRRRWLTAGETLTLKLCFYTGQGGSPLESKPLAIRVGEVMPFSEKSPFTLSVRRLDSSPHELSCEVKNISKEPRVVRGGYSETWWAHNTKAQVSPLPAYSKQRGDRLLLPGESYHCTLRLTFVDTQPGEKITTRVRLVGQYGEAIRVDSEPISLTVPQ